MMVVPHCCVARHRQAVVFSQERRDVVGEAVVAALPPGLIKGRPLIAGNANGDSPPVPLRASAGLAPLWLIVLEHGPCLPVP